MQLEVADSMLLPSSREDYERAKNVLTICERLNDEYSCDFPTEQFIHAGAYVRTAFMRKGSVLVGAKIKVDTVLIIEGDIMTNVNQKIKRYKGYHIVKALSPRQQYIYANEDSNITMIYATKASSIDDAEKEFTDDYEQLLTRK